MHAPVPLGRRGLNGVINYAASDVSEKLCRQLIRKTSGGMSWSWLLSAGPTHYLARVLILSTVWDVDPQTRSHHRSPKRPTELQYQWSEVQPYPTFRLDSQPWALAMEPGNHVFPHMTLHVRDLGPAWWTSRLRVASLTP